MKIIIAAIFAFTLSLSAQAQHYYGDSTAIQTILKNTEAFSAAYMSGDIESLSNSYTKDGSILPPGDDIIRGRTAIKEKWTLPEGVKILLHKVEPQEIRIIDEYAYDMGYYNGTTQKKDGSEVSWKGKYVIVWKWEENDWKIHLDSWSRIND